MSSTLDWANLFEEEAPRLKRFAIAQETKVICQKMRAIGLQEAR